MKFARNPYQSDVRHTQMPFFLDTRETTHRFGTPIAEFCSLLDNNHLRHGSPDDLFEFARTLESNNPFRADLSALVKSVVQKEREELLLTDMMSIIAASVGGPSVAETHTDITKPTNTLMEFLLGTGCWRQFGSSSRPIVQSAASPITKPSVRTEEPSPIRISLPASPVSASGESLEDRESLLEISNELRQTLTRLESNTEQVKHHLDSIEQRISKIKSPPEVHPTPISSGLEPLVHRGVANPVPVNIAQPAAQIRSTFEPELPTRGRAVFAHPLHDTSEIEDDDFSSPTFAYGTEKGRSIVPIGVFLVLLAIIAVALFYAHSGQGQTLLKAGISRLENIRAHFSHAPAPVAPAPTATLPPPSTPASASAAEVPASSATQPVPDKGVAGTVPTPAAASDSASSNIAADARPAPDRPTLRYIQANIMEGYLLSAPRPEYPALARTNHIEGQVTLQATISKTGSVETLHATKGPQSLRGAAIDAVRQWRYKPVSLDGQIREVATTVYVDFSLRPPPAIAH